MAKIKDFQVFCLIIKFHQNCINCRGTTHITAKIFTVYVRKGAHMGNRLKDQSSPYLLQHADNPVDWYPWGGEAFAAARQENKPVFLSVGYSTCHWCHVMAHESFENPEIAEILNQFFISVKVDREERPDIDSVYMKVCQAFTGNGGWPMSIFMTPDQKPFFAGTYFPPESQFGMIGFGDLLRTIAQNWETDRAALLESAGEILESLQAKHKNVKETIGHNLPKQAAEIFAKTFDPKNGGFGGAPKFPTPHNLLFLILYSRIEKDNTAQKQAMITLEKMRKGGIFDHIGYGFSRYSTDAYYLVPHFEKMLYDNALLIIAYAAAYKAGGNRIFLDTAEKTAEYILRDMCGSEGEFYSAEDADSEGEEGKFYLWDYDEICNVLGAKRGGRFCAHYGITKHGNFDGKNIPNLLNGNEITDAFEEERKLLYHYRKNRARLHLDDKILTAWNALMICALSVLYRTTGNEKYLSAAEKAQKFIETYLAEGDILYVSSRDHAHSVKGFLDDYAYYTLALLCLYEATAEESYLERAKKMCAEAERQFADEENGGYFLYGAENDSLITRPKETYDGALPSGNSVMAYCLVRLFQLTGQAGYEQAAKRQLAFLSGEACRYPAGYCMFLLAELLYFNPPQKITVVQSDADCKAADRIQRGACLARLPLYADVAILPNATEEYKLCNGKTTYYICKGHTCFPPTNQAP